MPKLSTSRYLRLSRGDGTPIGELRIWRCSLDQDGYQTVQGWTDHGPRFMDAVGQRVIATISIDNDPPYEAVVVNVVQKPDGVAGPRYDVVLSRCGTRLGPYGNKRDDMHPDDLLRAAYEPSIMNKLRAKHPPKTETVQKEKTVERELTKAKFKSALETKHAELEEQEEAYILAVSDALSSDEAIDAWMDDYSSLVGVISDLTKHASDGMMGERRKEQKRAIEETLKWLDLVAGGTVTMSEERINKLLK